MKSGGKSLLETIKKLCETKNFEHLLPSVINDIYQWEPYDNHNQWRINTGNFIIGHFSFQKSSSTTNNANNSL